MVPIDHFHLNLRDSVCKPQQRIDNEEMIVGDLISAMDKSENNLSNFNNFIDFSHQKKLKLYDQCQHNQQIAIDMFHDEIPVVYFSSNDYEVMIKEDD